MPALITRCPACATMFKVVPDQLRVSEGWVRCGHCAEVFDAAAHMVDASAMEQASQDGAPATMEEATAAPSEAAPAAIDAAAQVVPTERDAEANDVPSVPDEADELESITSEVPSELAGASGLDVEVIELRELPEDRPFELRREDIGGPQAAAAAVLMAETSPDPATPEPEPELHDLSFVKQARRQAFWTSRATRLGLSALAVLLVVALILQVAYRERDNIAAGSPEWRPWLSSMCGVFQCTIQPPRSIESIAIDNSSFNRLRGDAYRLNVTLRNQSSLPVALPALELTLTDSADQPVVRRVVPASELAPDTSVIAPRGEWSTSLALSVNANGLASRIAGYRVLAFYP